MAKKQKKTIAEQIQLLYNAGTTRAEIETKLGIKRADVQAVLGKSTRGRKPKAVIVQTPVATTPVKASKKTKAVKLEIYDAIALDESGSMSRVLPQTKAGVKKYIDDMKAKSEETKTPTFLGVVKFGSRVDVDFSPKAIDKVGKIDLNASSGMTALNDALLKAINILEPLDIEGLSVKRDFTVTVFTDGGENQSRHTDYNMIKKIVEEKISKGWTIAAVGPKDAEFDNWVKSVGIQNALSYDTSKKEEFTRAYQTMSASRSAKSDDVIAGKFSTTKYFKED
jgi:uncharacterized protein YegL